ncbi:hypothetical protein [Microbulbifer sp. PAAF003]
MSARDTLHGLEQWDVVLAELANMLNSNIQEVANCWQDKPTGVLLPQP